MDNIKINHQSGTGTYFGNVTITLKHGTKKYKTIKGHNNGTKEFFMYILNSIKGYSDYDNVPGYIYLYSDTSFETKTINVPILFSDVSESIGLSGVAAYNSDDSASMTYTFLVPDTLISGKTIAALQLISLTDKTVYANYVLSEAIEVSEDTNIVIDWELNIVNIS